jgi:hypothetical protein
MARAAGKDPDDPAYWLAKADEARAIAETMEYPETRSSMLWIARAYAIFGDWMRKQRNLNQPREPRQNDPFGDPNACSPNDCRLTAEADRRPAAPACQAAPARAAWL